MIHKPTVGRIVHFFASKDAKPEAAFVVDVTNEEDHVVNLAVFSHAGSSRPEVSVAFQGDSEERKSASTRAWAWPPRS